MRLADTTGRWLPRLWGLLLCLSMANVMATSDVEEINGLAWDHGRLGESTLLTSTIKLAQKFAAGKQSPADVAVLKARCQSLDALRMLGLHHTDAIPSESLKTLRDQCKLVSAPTAAAIDKVATLENAREVVVAKFTEAAQANDNARAAEMKATLP